jgi:hypothetical protein
MVEENIWLAGLSEDDELLFNQLALADEFRALDLEWERWAYCQEPSEKWDKDDSVFTGESEWAGFNKAKDLNPTHYLNSISTGVSLLCVLIWLFASPHQQMTAACNLDRTRKTIRFSWCRNECVDTFFSYFHKSW